MLARCVPGRQSVAIFALYVSQKGPGTGKAPLPGKIRAPCIQNELALARYARRVSEKPRKSPFRNAPREDLARKGPFSLHGPLESCTARESCHPVSTNRPSARGLGAVCVLRRRTAAREPPVLDHPIREARSRRLHPIDSWAVGIASSFHVVAAALCRHQPAACRPPVDNPVIADSGTCGDDIRTITVSLVRHAACV